jgi:hypothetical protein
MPDNIIQIPGTKANELTEFVGSIPDTQLVIVPDPITGKLLRTTFSQIKADVIAAFGGITYLDQIIEVPQVAQLPQPGVVKTIYVIIGPGPDQNKQFRWGGSMYIEFPRGSGDVAGEAIIRANADADLQNQINAEITARGNGDSDLQSKINEEATARANADTLLTQKISQETNTRINNDNTLAGLITSEGTIRAQADAALGQRIDDLEAQTGGVTKEYVDDADAALAAQIATKVTQVPGEGLSPEKFTLDEKNKLAALESSKFRGTYPSKAALDAADAGGEGNYADVDAGTGADVERWIWDTSDAKWVLQQGTSTSETAASIKQKYESNPDTNAFTDADKSKLTGLNNYDDTAITAAVANKVDKVAGKGLSANDYTTPEKTKLAGIATGAQVNDANTTLQGNAFNGVNQLVKTDGAGKLPAIDGSQLTNLPSSGGGTVIPSGTTIQMNAVVSPAVNQKFYNTDFKAQCYWNGTEWRMDIAIPTTAITGERVLTVSANTPAATYTLIDPYVGATTAADLDAANWSGTTVSLPGVAGERRLTGQNYIYECISENTWVRSFPLFLVLKDPNLGTVDDSAGKKTGAQLNALFPTAVPLQTAYGGAGKYEYMGDSFWAYYENKI